MMLIVKRFYQFKKKKFSFHCLFFFQLPAPACSFFVVFLCLFQSHCSHNVCTYKKVHFGNITFIQPFKMVAMNCTKYDGRLSFTKHACEVKNYQSFSLPLPNYHYLSLIIFTSFFNLCFCPLFHTSQRKFIRS